MESDCSLLVRVQRKGVRQVCYRASDLAAIKAPCERDPRAIFPMLVTQKRSLLKRLIVVNAESSHIERRVEDQAAHFRSEEPSPCVPKGRVRLKAMKIGSRDAHRKAINL